MKKMILIALMYAMTAQAGQNNGFLKVTGMDALKNHHINQYTDDANPPQAYDITLPSGHTLVAADVDSGEVAVCSVTRFDHKNQRLTIEALAIETDAGTCVVTLSIFRAKDKKTLKVQYSIEQTGT